MINMEEMKDTCINDALPDQRLRIGVAGNGGNACGSASEKIKDLLVRIRLTASAFNNSRNGYSGKNTSFDYYTSPLVADDFWMTFSSAQDSVLSVVSAVQTDDAGSCGLMHCASYITDLGLDASAYSSYTGVIDWICCQSDVLLLLWDGTADVQHGTMAALAEAAVKSGIFCLRADPRSGEIYSVKDFYWSESFSYAEMEKYVKSLYEQNPSVTAEQKPFLFSRLWTCCYKNFRAKYDRHLTLKNDPPDPILDRSYFDREGDTVRGRNHRRLADLFAYFDQKANTASKKYRESIYFRSILPFIATIFLAVGFYIETIGKFLIREDEAHRAAVFAWLSVIAGTGFLIHALLNFYCYRMSKSKTVQGCLREFINSRYSAEYLRNALYFLPFGIPVRQNILLPLYTVKLDNRTTDGIKRVFRSLEPSSYSFTQENCREILGNLSQMMDDQITYHQNTEHRYSVIVKALERFATALFYTGFIFVLARGIFQFIVPAVHEDSFITALNNGKSVRDFLQSFANMLALMLPAWASYFSTKLSLNNFKTLQEHSAAVEKKLEQFDTEINRMRALPHVSYDMFRSLADRILELQLSELTSWYTQTASKTVTKM